MTRETSLKDLKKWVSRKAKRCGKKVKVLKCYRTRVLTSLDYRRPTGGYFRAIVHVVGEGFTRRLHNCWGKWKEVEHGVLSKQGTHLV